MADSSCDSLLLPDPGPAVAELLRVDGNGTREIIAASEQLERRVRCTV